MKNFTDAELKKMASSVIKEEINALNLTLKSLDNNFAKAVKFIAKCKGRVAVVGIGKSGLIGRKIVATLASTGTPAFFVHPSEALHGDLGMIMSGDVVLALSYSGQTEEISKILPSLLKSKTPIISITGNKKSKLALMSQIHIPVVIAREACPCNLAPTSSTTAMLAVGDALAVCLMETKEFGKKDFAVFHPGGSLGKLLTNSVKDIMRSGKLNPVVSEKASVKDALFVMTNTKSGAANVVDAKGKLKGFFTDGDLRRCLQKDANVLSKKITEVMTKNPMSLTEDMSAVEAARAISARRIDNAPVVDKAGKAVGILDETELVEFIALVDKK